MRVFFVLFFWQTECEMSDDRSKNAAPPSPDLTLEESCQGPVCGIDEAGRGPLAGPVLAACICLPENIKKTTFWRQIRDSKKLSAKKREVLFLQIREDSSFGIGMASVEEIDSLNIHHATLLAMRRAYNSMLNEFSVSPATALIDGKFAPNLRCDTRTVIKGDNKSLSIAAASILAKVTRDRIMARLHQSHPVYGWTNNAGYGTKEHINAIRDHGITDHHRRSFAPNQI